MAKGKKKKKTTTMKKSTYRVLKGLFILFVILILLAVGAWVAIHLIFNFEEEADRTSPSGVVDVIEKEEKDPPPEEQVEMLSALQKSDKLENMLRDWALNGGENAHMRSNDVINFLLVGTDERGENTDVMMLVSVNQLTRRIVLTSVMRDAYTFINTGERNYCTKLNAAYAGGGMRCLKETLQNDYKIRIDHYVLVGYDTFIKIVDLLGGVEVPLQYYEAREMERIAGGAEGSSVTEYGEKVKLTGFQSLLYCRIRKCDVDADISRTRRQRQFITALIDECRGMNASTATSLVKTLLAYVKTDCSATELVDLATRALVNGWKDYELVSQVCPFDGSRMDYQGSQWIWVVDYPLDAVALHLSIYGKTNIELPENRVTAIDVMRNSG